MEAYGKPYTVLAVEHFFGLRICHFCLGLSCYFVSLASPCSFCRCACVYDACRPPLLATKHGTTALLPRPRLFSLSKLKEGSRAQASGCNASVRFRHKAAVQLKSIIEELEFNDFEAMVIVKLLHLALDVLAGDQFFWKFGVRHVCKESPKAI